MPSTRPVTTIRFLDGDRENLEALQELTGLKSAAAVIRLAVRESLDARRRKARRR